MMDTDNNLGDFTAARSFTLPAITDPGGGGGPTTQTFRVSLDRLSREEEDEDDQADRAQRELPAGGRRERARLRRRRGSRDEADERTGEVTFRVRAKRYPGTVTFRVTKPGFETETYKRTSGRPRPGPETVRQTLPGPAATTATSMRAPDGSAAISTVARAGYGSRRWRA